MNGPWYCVSFSFITNLRAIFDVFQENFMLFICLQCTFVDPKRSLWFVRVMSHNSLAPPHPFQCDVARCITSNKVKSSRGTMKCLFCFFVQMLQLLGRRKTKIKFWSGTYKAPSNCSRDPGVMFTGFATKRFPHKFFVHECICSQLTCSRKHELLLGP